MSPPPGLAALRRGEIDPAAFGHVDHLRVAHEALRTQEFFAALAELAEGLRALAARAGVPEKYSAAVTMAFMSLVAEREAHGAYEDFEAFLADNRDLCDGATLGACYSAPRLNTALACRVAPLPDRAGAAG